MDGYSSIYGVTDSPRLLMTITCDENIPAGGRTRYVPAKQPTMVIPASLASSREAGFRFLPLAGYSKSSNWFRSQPPPHAFVRASAGKKGGDNLQGRGRVLKFRPGSRVVSEGGLHLSPVSSLRQILCSFPRACALLFALCNPGLPKLPPVLYVYTYVQSGRARAREKTGLVCFSANGQALLSLSRIELRTSICICITLSAHCRRLGYLAGLL